MQNLLSFVLISHALPCKQTKENKIQTKDVHVTEPQRYTLFRENSHYELCSTAKLIAWLSKQVGEIKQFLCFDQLLDGQNEPFLLARFIATRKRVPVLLHIESLIGQS